MKKQNDKTNKTTTTKKNDVQMINVNNVDITIDEYKKSLIEQLRKSNIAKNSKLSKSIRHKLRKTCKHYGAMRNRTYIDKSTTKNERVIINK